MNKIDVKIGGGGGGGGIAEMNVRKGEKWGGGGDYYATI